MNTLEQFADLIATAYMKGQNINRLKITIGARLAPESEYNYLFYAILTHADGRKVEYDNAVDLETAIHLVIYDAETTNPNDATAQVVRSACHMQ